MDRSGRLRRREKSHVAPFVFTGIQIVSKRLLKDAPDGPFSTNILWDRAIEAGRCFGAVHQGLWFDVGNPQAIGDTEAFAAECLTARTGRPAVYHHPDPPLVRGFARQRTDREIRVRPAGAGVGAGSCFPTTAPSAR